MVAQYQVTLTKTIQQRAERLAEIGGTTVEDMLPVLLMLSNPIFTYSLDFDRPISELSDEEVLAIVDLKMLPEVDANYRELVHTAGQRELTDEEKVELDLWTKVSGIGLVYKSEGLAEAVRRGLREPLALSVGWHPPHDD